MSAMKIEESLELKSLELKKSLPLVAVVKSTKSYVSTFDVNILPGLRVRATKPNQIGLEGEVWVVLSTACAVLDSINHIMALKRLPEDCIKKVDIVDGRGQVRETW